MKRSEIRRQRGYRMRLMKHFGPAEAEEYRLIMQHLREIREAR